MIYFEYKFSIAQLNHYSYGSQIKKLKCTITQYNYCTYIIIALINHAVKRLFNAYLHKMINPCISMSIFCTFTIKPNNTLKSIGIYNKINCS